MSKMSVIVSKYYCHELLKSSLGFFYLRMEAKSRFQNIILGKNTVMCYVKEVSNLINKPSSWTFKSYLEQSNFSTYLKLPLL
jgi:hypothetical protein